MADGTRVVNGVRVVCPDGSPHYTVQDVATVIGMNVSTAVACLPKDMREKADVGGWSDRSYSTHPMHVTSAAGVRLLAGTVCDWSAVPEVRRTWIMNWASDTERIALANVEPKDDGVDSIYDFPEGLTETMARMDAERIDGLESRIGELRDEVRNVADSMGRALQCLQDGVTYLDGFRSGALMASGDVPGMGGIQSLFVDLRGVEDEMSRIHSRLEDIANGGDGK